LPLNLLKRRAARSLLAQEHRLAASGDVPSKIPPTIAAVFVKLSPGFAQSQAIALAATRHCLKMARAIAIVVMAK
jgi:hypothetical protein